MQDSSLLVHNPSLLMQSSSILVQIARPGRQSCGCARYWPCSSRPRASAGSTPADKRPIKHQNQANKASESHCIGDCSCECAEAPSFSSAELSFSSEESSFSSEESSFLHLQLTCATVPIRQRSTHALSARISTFITTAPSSSFDEAAALRTFHTNRGSTTHSHTTIQSFGDLRTTGRVLNGKSS